MHPILVLGLGNPLQGDDGVGCRVVERIVDPSAHIAWPEQVDVMDGGTPGVGLLNLFEGRKRVLIVDAAEMNLAPGLVRRFTADEITLTGSPGRFSLHRTGVADALALARALKMTQPEIVFFGVEPANICWGDILSPQVQAAIPLVIDALLEELNKSV